MSHYKLENIEISNSVEEYILVIENKDMLKNTTS